MTTSIPFTSRETRPPSSPDSQHSDSTKSDWGTFKDSLRAPIHNWFTYPAGFSYRAVEHYLRTTRTSADEPVLYDPFMGSGTSNIVAKLAGIDSIGVEAHPFVHRITQTKLNWDLDFPAIVRFVKRIEHDLDSPSETQAAKSNSEIFPELLLKCFLPVTLYQLRQIRDLIKSSRLAAESKQFLETALICSLRDVSIAATGWPYIAPKKTKITSLSKQPFPVFANRVDRMISDVQWAIIEAAGRNSKHAIMLGDSRAPEIASDSASHIFTSPPYLNNFDYADRTRLEMYFTGDAASWGDISKAVRTKLMTSATTQISRTDPKYDLSTSLRMRSPRVHEFLEGAISRLAEIRLEKGGKKSYDLMVAGYFNDMTMILAESARILKSGGSAAFVLGDSAPYGVHIPTDSLIGEIAIDVGFKNYFIEPLRVRGGKWANNPQRHGVALRESIVHLRN